MAVPHEQVHTQTREIQSSMRYLLGGSLSEGLAGAGAVAVAIIALASGDSAVLLSIATILVGGALMFEGGAIAARYSNLLHETSHGAIDSTELGAGMSAQLIGGMGVVTLGILALLSVDATVLAPIAAIVGGGAVLLGSGATARMNALKIEKSGESDEARHLAHAAVSSAAGVQLFIGISAIVLGILGVLHIATAQLAVIAMLALGASVLMGGAALSGMSVMFRR